MTSNKKTSQVITEMKQWLDDTPTLLEGFYLPEEMEEPMDEPDSFEEEPSMQEPAPQRSDNEIAGIEKELTQIRKIALSVINRLADQPQSPQYDTMKKIWNMVDKAIEQPTKPQKEI